MDSDNPHGTTHATCATPCASAAAEASRDGVHAPAPSRLRRWGRRAAKTLLVAVPLLLLVIGPWPSRNPPWQHTRFGEEALEAAASVPIAHTRTGTLRAGIGIADITPLEGQPLMGYSARSPMGRVGVDGRCFVRVLTLERGGMQVSIVTADILLLFQPLRDEILRRADLSHGDVFFTASHTHSGAGGWAKGVVEEMFFGRFDPDAFERLAEAFSRAILDSRRDLVPVAISTAAVEVPEWQENRLERGRPTFDTLFALCVQPVDDGGNPDGAPLAILTSYAAHATVISANRHDASPDYPGGLMAGLQEATGARMVLFASGAASDARPLRKGDGTEEDKARRMGHALAGRIAPAILDAPFEHDVTLAHAFSPLTLPPHRITLGARWQLSPIASFWMMRRESHASVLRIGSTVFAGFPGDYGGSLARDLADAFAKEDIRLVPTSFNGDWKSYLTAHEEFMTYDCYETRMMAFFGPWTGEYLNGIAEILIRRTLAY